MCERNIQARLAAVAYASVVLVSLGSHDIVAAATAPYASTLNNTSSTLLSKQSGIVAESIKAQSAGCAAGTLDGSIGKAITQAIKIHTEIASAPPAVEQLFDTAGGCFDAAAQLFDLSFSIPSVGAIVGAAQSAVVKFARRKVCSAVTQAVTMVTTPINQVIDKVNTITDLNGQANAALGGQLAKLDPQLGRDYYPPASGTSYTVNTNPFNTAQTDFGGVTPATMPAARPVVTAPTITQTPVPRAVSTPDPALAPTPAPADSGSSGTLYERAGNLFR